MSTGPRTGYMQSPPFTHNGRTYVERTYVVGGRSYSLVYRDYIFGGRHYYEYAPLRFYQPGFYAWAYNPSASLWLTDYLLAENLKLADANGPGGGVEVPANQQWTDTGIELNEGDAVNITARGVISYRPGSNAYPGGAPPDCRVAGPQSDPFPAPQLPCWSLVGRIGESGEIFEVGSRTKFQSPTAGELYLGVNDNILGDNSGSWTASIQALQPTEVGSATPLSYQVKEEIAAQVKSQLEAEQAESSAPSNPPAVASRETPPAALVTEPGIFVVSSSLTVATPEGLDCELTGGDVISRWDDSPGQDGKVTVKVTTSKQGDCKVGSKPRVDVNDLQEMLNSFQEQLDSGLQTMAQKSGTNGLPKAPDSNTTSGEVQAPKPDPTAAGQLEDQQKEANQIEAQVR